MRASTPEDLAIHPRDMRFNREETDSPRWWLAGDPIATAFYNALSAAFPAGEAFSVEAIRLFQDQADPKLKEQMAGFIKQEFAHAREHAIFNRLIKKSGYEIDWMDRKIRELIELSRTRPPVAQIAATVAVEHFTALIGRELIRNPKHLASAPADVRRMWEWHCFEELDHKTVAFDTYLMATKHLSAFKRWRIRCKVMLFVSTYFWQAQFRYLAMLFRQDGINTLGTWLRLFSFLWIKPGLFRIATPGFFRFFRPGFHPWEDDDTELLAQAEARLAK